MLVLKNRVSLMSFEYILLRLIKKKKKKKLNSVQTVTFFFPLMLMKMPWEEFPGDQDAQ